MIVCPVAIVPTMKTSTAKTHTVRIDLTGVHAFGYHGVLPSERRNGQQFVVDAALWITEPGNDDLASSVDYSAVAELIVQIVGGQPVNLIETLAARIAQALIERIESGRVRVTVHKPCAPLNVPVSDVSVRVERSTNGR